MLKFKALPQQNIIFALTFFCFGIICMDIFPIVPVYIFSGLVLIGALFSKKLKFIILAVILLLGNTCYFSYRLVPINHIGRETPKNIKYVEGYISSDIEKKSNSYLFYLNAKKYKTTFVRSCSGKVAVYLKCTPNINQGDYIRVSSFFFAPTSNNPDFDYEKFLLRKNIYIATSVKNTKDITVLKKQKAPPLIRQAKAYTIKVYNKYLHSDTSKLLMGMVLGNGNYLDDTTYNNFINTSTLHLLAASGLNCYVLVIILWYIFGLIEFRKKNLITITLVWFYAALINFPASILRAALMCSLALLSETLKLGTSYKNIFYISAFLLLLINPSYIFDIGFQLSYFCIFALLYIAGPSCNTFNIFWKKYCAVKRKPFYFHIVIPIADTIISTLSVFIITTPISIYYFHNFSLIGVFTNILIGFLASLIFVISFLFLFLCIIPFIREFFIIIINFLGNIILFAINSLGNLKFAKIEIFTLNSVFLFTFYFIAFLFFVYIYPNCINNLNNTINHKYKSQQDIFPFLPDKK